MKKASIASRIFAFVIDLYLAVFITMMMILILINWFADNIALSVCTSLLILAAISSIVFKDIVDGRSIGKRIFNIGVRELDNTVPSTKKLISRNFSSLFWPKDIYYLLFSTEKRKQGDIRNGTEVYQLRIISSTKKVLTLVISISMIVCLFIGGLMTMIKQDASYKAAITYIKNDSGIQEEVGHNIRFGFFPSGSISRSNGHGEASFKINVTGDKGSLSVFISLAKEATGNWKVKYIDY